MSLTSYQAAPPRVLVGKVNRSPNYERLKSVGLARTPKMQPQPEMLRGRISQMTQIIGERPQSLPRCFPILGAKKSLPSVICEICAICGIPLISIFGLSLTLELILLSHG